MSISTGTGDRGETGLVGGARISKADARIETIGSIDELNAAIGIARSAEPASPCAEELARIANWLFDLGSDLALPGAGLTAQHAERLPESAAKTLEEWIHREEAALPRLRAFILPGGTPLAAQLHFARTVCRRAERRAVAHHAATGEARRAIVFLNRLSDLLFLYARGANRAAGFPDVEWKPPK
ncbi:MAG: cob(I)yrinic acid a,c-diamide adenosyltransferase [Planctomycetes bacterium]|nr:cob(I)yrinic acid a,c-diamide adenosyltransferase [Planctomycetota bacterium]